MSKIKNIIPVKCGGKIELTVEDLMSSGDGICKLNGYTLFVPGSLPGDKVFVEICKTTPKFGVCKILKIISDSPDRIKPLCSVFYRCGGCQLQTFPYAKQVEFKTRVVLDSLERIGKLEVPLKPLFVQAANPFSFRNKGTFVCNKERGKLKIGFYKHGSHDVVHFRHCPVMLEPINIILDLVYKIIKKCNISIYNEKKHKGLLRNIIIRGSVKTKEFLIGLITNGNYIDKRVVLEIKKINFLSHLDFKIVGIIQSLNKEKGNVILGKKNNTLWGRDFFIERLGDINYQLSLSSFFQVNSTQAENLNQIVEEMVPANKGKVLDAYCGVGNLALWLGSKNRSVVGVESNSGAVYDAIENKKKNSIKTCEFICDSIENFIKNKETGDKYSSVVLDPPRKGVDKYVIERLIGMSPLRIVYVSCNPATLARDLNILCNGGYKIKDIKIIDMFPQTVHMETVVLLESVQGYIC